MAFYYVSDGATVVGTATGDGGRETVQRTGAWSTTASESYASLEAAFGATTPPAAGDFIYVASDHDHNYSASSTITGPVSGTNISIMSMDVTAQDQYLAGANEDIDGGAAGNDLVYQEGLSFFGMQLETRDVISVNIMHGEFVDCTLILGTVNDNGFAHNGDDRIRIINSTITSNGINQGLTCDSGAKTELYSVTCDGTGWEVGLLDPGSGDGDGFDLIAVDCDFSSVGSTGAFIQSVGGNSADDTIEIKLSGCEMNASNTGFMDEDFIFYGSYFKAVNCTSTSAAAEYQFFYKDWAGETEDNTTTYRNESTAYAQASQKVSLATDTSTQAVCAIGREHVFDFPSRPVDLSLAAEDKLTVYLTSDTALTDTDVWLEVIYPDGTNKHTYNRTTTRNADILAAGTALTTDTGSTWTSGKTYKYRIEVDTSGDPGEYCVPIIRCHIAVQAIIYFDSQVDLS